MPALKRPLSIGIIGRVLDQQDGLGLYALNLLTNMFAQDRETRYVLLLSTSSHSQSFRCFQNVECHVLPSRSKLWWDQVTVPLAARRTAVDVLFNPKFSIPLLTTLPCVFVLQGADWYVNPGNYPWWDNLYIRAMLPLYCRKASRLLVISEATLADLAAHIKIDRTRTAVTYAAVGSNFTPHRDESTLQRFRGDRRLPDNFILTVARAYHSGLTHSPPYPGGNNERLIRAYRSYRAAGGELPLVVIGHRIEEYLRACGLGDGELDGVQFLGFVPNAEMHLAYQLATCFILATLCESFGLPILEALATGCPAIVPTTCAAPEIAGGAARLINPYDVADIARALDEITTSADRRRQMGARGIARARAFSWAETARHTIANLTMLAA